MKGIVVDDKIEYSIVSRNGHSSLFFEYKFINGQSQYIELSSLGYIKEKNAVANLYLDSLNIDKLVCLSARLIDNVFTYIKYLIFRELFFHN